MKVAEVGRGPRHGAAQAEHRVRDVRARATRGIHELAKALLEWLDELGVVWRRGRLLERLVEAGLGQRLYIRTGAIAVFIHIELPSIGNVTFIYGDVELIRVLIAGVPNSFVEW